MSCSRRKTGLHRSGIRLILLTAIALAATGCLQCNPASPSAAGGVRQEVWVSPNVGSRDFLDLFRNPGAWATARAKITTLEFAVGSLDDSCDICGPNILRNFIGVVPGGAFRWLASEHLRIAIGAPSVKAWDCSGAVPAAQTIAAIGNVVANGGSVSDVEMDEPFISGLPPNQGFAASMPTCRFTVGQTALTVAAYVSRVHAAYPSVRIGLVEPHPYFSAAQIESFVDALSSAGVTLPFFHLDYDESFLSVDPVPDFLELRRFFQQRQVPFGIVIIGVDGSSGELASTGALTSALRISNVLGIHSLPHVLFDSWLDYPPLRGQQDLRLYPDNLPDTTQTTMMGLVNTVLDHMP